MHAHTHILNIDIKFRTHTHVSHLLNVEHFCYCFNKRQFFIEYFSKEYPSLSFSEFRNSERISLVNH